MAIGFCRLGSALLFAAACCCFLTPSWAVADEPSAARAETLANAQYKFGDHKAAFATLKQAAEAESDATLKDTLLAKRYALEAASAAALDALDPASRKRLDLICETLATKGFDLRGTTLKRDDFVWAWTGAARPFVIDAFRNAERLAEDQDDPVSKWLREGFEIEDLDERINVRVLRFQVVSTGYMLHVAEQLKAGEELTDEDLENASKEPLVRKFYENYANVKREKNDPKVIERKKNENTIKELTEANLALMKELASLATELEASKKKLDGVRAELARRTRIPPKTTSGKKIVRDLQSQEQQQLDEIHGIEARSTAVRVKIEVHKAQMNDLRLKGDVTPPAAPGPTVK